MSGRRAHGGGTLTPVGALLVSAVLSSALTGCGTVYQPRPGPRVGMVIHHGGAMYVKDGKETPIGAFGGGLSTLVGSSAAAEAHAHTARTELSVGVPCYVGGVTAVIVSLTLLSGPVGWVVLGVGAATGGTGLGLLGAGFTHVVDAVNIHNDAISR